MQCDVPVIASDIPAHRWVLGDAAVYCDSYDPHAIAAAIERLVACDDSQALRSEMIVRGRQRVKLYSLDRCREAWLKVLDRAAGESSSGQPRATLALTALGATQRAA
jgi:glycosyltransferase involved in cell wall biosynthesis